MNGAEEQMHEMSLAESVRQIIEDAASREGFQQVKKVWLEIGQLACVEVEAMRFCFDVAMRGSVAEGARLEIVETAGHGRCKKCTRDFAVTTLHEPCPNCGSYEIGVTNGDGMRVKELEVE